MTTDDTTAGETPSSDELRDLLRNHVKSKATVWFHQLDARCRDGFGPTVWEMAKDRRIAELEKENERLREMLFNELGEDAIPNPGP